MRNVGIHSLDDDRNESSVGCQTVLAESPTTYKSGNPPEAAAGIEHVASAMKTMSITRSTEETHIAKSGGSPASTLSSSNTQGTGNSMNPPGLFSAITEQTGSPVRHGRRRRSSSRSDSHDPEEPLHCQPWCHHGTCERGDACRSKHEMPASVEGLKKVGLEKFPYWYSSGKSSRQSPAQAERDWSSRKHMGRGPMQNSSRTAHSGSRYPPRQPSYEENRARDERPRREVMNRDIRSGERETRRDVTAASRERTGVFQDHTDLISMD